MSSMLLARRRDLDDDVDVDIPFLMGQVAGVIKKVQPAKEIMDEMVQECVDVLSAQQSYLGGAKSKL